LTAPCRQLSGCMPIQNQLSLEGSRHKLKYCWDSDPCELHCSNWKI